MRYVFKSVRNWFPSLLALVALGIVAWLELHYAAALHAMLNRDAEFRGFLERNPFFSFLIPRTPWFSWITLVWVILLAATVGLLYRQIRLKPLPLANTIWSVVVVLTGGLVLIGFCVILAVFTPKWLTDARS
jgi:glucose-6-phosphate-specific signal transduction histidine kinase